MRSIELEFYKNAKRLEPLNWRLIKAAGDNDPVAVKSALRQGANIHFRGNGALRAALENSHPRIVKLLIENGADVRYDNDVFLAVAAERGPPMLIEMLVDAGCDLKKNGAYALLCAARKGIHTTTEYLIECGQIDLTLCGPQALVLAKNHKRDFLANRLHKKYGY